MKELRKALEEYFTVRRALGFKLRGPGSALHKFVSFLERKRSSFITTKLALCWATQPANVQPVRWAKRLGMVRLFAHYHSAADPRTEIPPKGLLPYRYRRKPPYIYSQGEIIKLLKAAKRLPSKIGLRPKTYYTLLGLIVVTGMRISEIISLNNDDVNLDQAVLTIRKTKFRKTRLVPIHSSTQRKLQQYIRLRNKIHPKLKNQSFFVSDIGIRLTDSTVRWTFVRLSRKTGLRKPSDSHGPRLHDLRHRFAVETILGWYRKNVDVERHMPELSTFLGHVNVTDTYWYLSASPELLQLAAERLNHTKGELS